MTPLERLAADRVIPGRDADAGQLSEDRHLAFLLGEGQHVGYYDPSRDRYTVTGNDGEAIDGAGLAPGLCRQILMDAAKDRVKLAQARAAVRDPSTSEGLRAVCRAYLTEYGQLDLAGILSLPVPDEARPSQNGAA
jgi:hypothetical protein